ncbi:MAG: adenylate cyclase [Saprospiraceae bacterium]|jgi:adenylate cyclase
MIGLAYKSGFNSKTVFNTYFKKETGMTPKQYIKQLSQ